MFSYSLHLMAAHKTNKCILPPAVSYSENTEVYPSTENKNSVSTGQWGSGEGRAIVPGHDRDQAHLM